jgi:hypothetical protein
MAKKQQNYSENDTNFMIEKLEQSVKRGTESVIERIIGKLFDLLIQPILDLILKLVEHIKDKHQHHKKQKNIVKRTYRSLVKDYLISCKVDCVIFDTCNGEKSTSGRSFNYLQAIFTKLTYSDTKYLQQFHNSYKIPMTICNSWCKVCEDELDIEGLEYHNYGDTIKVYFKDYAFIQGRIHKGLYIMILGSSDAMPLEDIQEHQLFALIGKAI